MALNCLLSSQFRTQRRFRLLLVLFLVPAFHSCNNNPFDTLFHVKISKIHNDTHKYHDRTISIKGKVTSSFNFLGYSGFEIDDGSGKIFVTGIDIAPSTGQTVKVKGRVKVLFSFNEMKSIVFEAERVR